MPGRLLLLFLLVPAAEVAGLVAVGGRIGVWPTFGLVVFAAAAGSFLARREGLATWRRVQARLAEGGLPGPELLDGLIALAAAVLLLSPGFVTDVAGLLGLFPPTRAVVRRLVQRRLARGVAAGRLRAVPSAGGPFGGGPFAGGPFAGDPPGPVVEDAELIDDGRPGRRAGA